MLVFLPIFPVFLFNLQWHNDVVDVSVVFCMIMFLTHYIFFVLCMVMEAAIVFFGQSLLMVRLGWSGCFLTFFYLFPERNRGDIFGLPLRICINMYTWTDFF